MRYLKPFKNNVQSVRQKPPAWQPFVVWINEATTLSHCSVQRDPTQQLFAARLMGRQGFRQKIHRIFCVWVTLRSGLFAACRFLIGAIEPSELERPSQTREDLLIPENEATEPESIDRSSHTEIFKMRNGNKQLRKDPLGIGDLVLVSQRKASYFRTRAKNSSLSDD